MIQKLALSLLLLANALASSAEELPVEYFFKNYEFSQVSLSPDGKHLAAIAPVGDSRNLVVVDRATMKPLAVTSLTKRDVASYQWASNERLLFSVEEDGNESFALNAVNIDGSKPRVLTKASKGIQLIPRYTRMVDRLKEDDRHVIVTSNDRKAQFPDLYRMDIYTGRKKRLTSNPGNITGWGMDWDHKVRVAMRQVVASDKSDASSELLYRETEDAPWKVLATSHLGQENTEYAGFSADNKTLYISSAVGRDRQAVYTLDPATGKKELVFGHDEVDVGTPSFSPSDHRPLGIGYITDKPHMHYLDTKFGSIQKALDKALPDTLNRLTSLTDDEKTAVVVATSDKTPGTYYLLETEPKLKLTYLAQIADRIKPELMADMKPIRYKARDGLLIHGYLTLPKGAEGKPVPLIIHPHGGPYGIRDNWGWNPEVQFLANRGYAVLQMNYRGSGGYGNKFHVNAWQQWGLQMQDDISDAVKWAIKEGIADPKRVCIYGASYGGYATMAGLTMTPDLYKCGINYVGVVDLDMLEEWDTRHDQEGGITAWFHRAIGDPDNPKDQARMEKTSPINLLTNLDDPLFIIHGRRDPRVEIAQAEHLMSKLNSLGKPYIKLIKKKEGHGFRREANKLELYKMMDKFLKKNL
ncbi:S9 family peptidase [Thiolapillus brandeum]|uniref:Peptidase S9 prolyl oligopeptidase n=1 Tax=Thiolapillus brandeum TaxID=1076588 RepID=A0A7U6JFR1_9GAMM|nr:S9 family peptidase [Thiolapillus brandeum]BAO43011.1 peptidase S9 prolyl oligopeptidase [Thiolapillus brandeum]